MSENNFFNLNMLNDDAEDVAIKLFFSFDEEDLKGLICYEEDSNSIIDEGLTFEAILEERFSSSDREFIELYSNEKFKEHLLEISNELMERIKEFLSEEEEEEKVEVVEIIIDGTLYFIDRECNVYDNEGESIGIYRDKWVAAYV